MKLNRIKIGSIILSAVLLGTGCNKDVLDRPDKTKVIIRIFGVMKQMFAYMQMIFT